MCNYNDYRTWRDKCCEAWKPKEKETNMVEVVRCKDCKHSCDYTDIYTDSAYKCIKNGGYHNDSWFCADGERR